MVKYGLFAAQQAQEQSSQSLSSPLLNPCAVPWCRCTMQFTLPMLALLGSCIIHGKSERSVLTSPSLPGRLPTFPILPLGQQKWRQLQGREVPAGDLGLPQGREARPCACMAAALQGGTSKWILLSPHQLFFAYSTVLLLICRTAIERRQQRNEGIASQFPSVANKIHQALWENQELYLQSASFYLLRDKQG